MPQNEYQLVPGTGPTRRFRMVSLDMTLACYDGFMSSVMEAARQGKPGMVCFANSHMLVEGVKRPEFAQLVNRADWVAADGVPLVWALRKFSGYDQNRIAGMDVMPDLLSRAAQEGLGVFFYGSTPDVLERAITACRRQFSGLQIVGQESPPFRSLTPAEEDATAARIRASGARLVFVALGCPKQERWMARMQGRVPAILLGVGGALPLLAGSQRRAPAYMRQAGLEWLFRLAQEPRRLFKRYMVTNSLFVYYIAKHALAGRSEAN